MGFSSVLSRRVRCRSLGYIVCVLTGLAAAQPVLVRWRLPQGHDAFFHLHRLIQLDALLHQGILFSRWAPDLARGFGYPLFNYYAPLSYYLPLALHGSGLSFQSALLGAFLLLFVGSALAMYLWVRDSLGERAALLAAAANVFSPYSVLNLALRTVLAEMLALALLPLALFGVGRLFATRRPGYAVLLSFCLAALILAHNVTALLFMPFLLGYIAAMAAVSRSTGKGTGDKNGTARKEVAASSIQACLAVLGAIGLTAFYWLPALAERNLVQMDRLTVWSIFDYRLGFLSLKSIFALPVLGDLHQINRPVPLSLSLVAACLALVGLLGVWRWRPSPVQRAQIGSAALAMCGALFMVLPASAAVWAAFPSLRILQFPWRFLGFANLFLAFLAGSGLRAVEGEPARGRAGTVILPIAICVLFAWVFTWQHVAEFHPQTGPLTISDVLRYERETSTIGTTTAGEYLPFTVKSYPPPEAKGESNNRERFDTASLPAGARVIDARYEPLQYTLTIETPAPFEAPFNTFYFAGWRAWVDGAEVPIIPTDLYGLISVPVPAGTHELCIRFGSTPVRTLSNLISLVAAAALLAGMVWSWVWGRRCYGAGGIHAGEAAGLPVPPCSGSDTLSSSIPAPVLHKNLFLPTNAAWAIIGLLVIAFGLKTLLIDPLWAGYRRTNFDITANANYANQLILMGADRPQVVASGEVASVVLYWRIPAKIEAQYSISTQLVDERGLLYAQGDNQHPGGVPTTVWSLTSYIRDPHNFAVPAGTPPGRYMLRVVAYPYGRPEETLNILDEHGAPIGRWVELTTLEVGRPNRAPREEELAITTTLDRSQGTNLVLLGYDLSQREARTGEKLALTLFWKAAQALETDLSVQLQLLGESGEVAHHQDVPPVPGYDTVHWQPGDIWRGTQLLIIPPRLSGRYTIAVAAAGMLPVSLGGLNVLAPPHAFTAPRTAYTQQAMFADLVSLVGYDVTGSVQPGQKVTVTLVWHVERETLDEYKVFVQLFDSDGRMWMTSDSVPGDWQRPSPSWVVGEYITDPHTLSLPDDLLPGTYHLMVGLYDSATLKRLLLADGADALILSQTLDM